MKIKELVTESRIKIPDNIIEDIKNVVLNHLNIISKKLGIEKAFPATENIITKIHRNTKVEISLISSIEINLLDFPYTPYDGATLKTLNDSVTLNIKTIYSHDDGKDTSSARFVYDKNNPNKSSLELTINRYLFMENLNEILILIKGDIRHEMNHFAQAYFFHPKQLEKAKNQDIDEYLNSMVERYPMLESALADFEIMAKADWWNFIDNSTRQRIFRQYVGMDQKEPIIISFDDQQIELPIEEVKTPIFFKSVKNKSPDNYKQVVKAFYKMIQEFL